MLYCSDSQNGPTEHSAPSATYRRSGERQSFRRRESHPYESAGGGVTFMDVKMIEAGIQFSNARAKELRSLNGQLLARLLKSCCARTPAADG